MQNFLLGEYIRQRRLDLGLTQAEVCSGICEPITLSRLENGKQTPSRNRINAILQRLGLPDDRYYALLSPNELKIEALKKEIIGCNVTDIGDNKKAAEIYYQVLRYMRKHFDENVISAGNWPLILYNYARVLDLCHRYEDGAECAKECREKCVKYGHYQFLPDCLEIEAECKYFLGKTKESIDLYRQAYYLCKVIGYQDSLDIIKKEAKEYLNIEFED